MIFTSSTVSGFGPGRSVEQASRGRARPRAGERGQALVEFSLVVVPFLFMVLAIIQFAFVFQAWITLNSAVRDASREASLYVYDTNSTQAANDLAPQQPAQGRSCLPGSTG